MNRLQQRSRTCAVVGVLCLMMAGCQRGPELETATAADARIRATPFNGQSFQTRYGETAITFISPDELEYRIDRNTTLLCKYTEQGQAVRVVLTMLGTQQVMYFRRVRNGLESNDGQSFLTAAAWADIQRQEETARQREAEAKAAADRERSEQERIAAIEAQHAAEEASRQRAALVGEARKAAAPLASAQCTERAQGSGPEHFWEIEFRTYRFVVTPASVSRELIKLTARKNIPWEADGRADVPPWSPLPNGKPEIVWFDELSAKPAVFDGSHAPKIDRMLRLNTDSGTSEWYCSGDPDSRAPAEELGRISEATASALDKWKARFPALARW